MFLNKCKNDCLVYEMFFFIDKLRPSLDIQSDSIRAKVFCMLLLFLTPQLSFRTYFYFIISLLIQIYLYVTLHIDLETENDHKSFTLPVIFTVNPSK